MRGTINSTIIEDGFVLLLFGVEYLEKVVALVLWLD